MGKWMNAVLSVLFLFSATTAAYSAAINHGSTGIANTAKVSSILQLLSDSDAPVGANFFSSTSPSDNYNWIDIKPWRKDGDWLVFTSNYTGTGDFDKEVCKIKPDGTGFSRLTENMSEDSNASFSKSDKIYYNIFTSSPDYHRKIARRNQDGSGYVNLSDVTSNTNDTKPVVSTNGYKIAYTEISGFRLKVANNDGSLPVFVSGTYNSGSNDISVYQNSFSWSPDSQWIVYSGQASSNRIFKVKDDGSSHIPLTSSGDSTLQDGYPVWSPDGTKIVYRTEQYDSGTGTTTYQMKTVDSSGTALQTLDTATFMSGSTTGWSNIYPPFSWSPDSKWIAYSKRYSNTGSTISNAIFIVYADGSGSPVQLTQDYYDITPFWGPHGSQISFASEDNKTSRESGCSPTCQGQILLMNLIGDFGNSVPFSWLMFSPAMQGKQQ